MSFKETFPSNDVLLHQPPHIGLMVWESNANENSVWLEIIGNNCRLALAQDGRIKGEAQFKIDTNPLVQGVQSLSRAQDIVLSGPIFKGFLSQPQTDENKQDRLERLLWMARIAIDCADLGISLDQESLLEIYQFAPTEKFSARTLDLIRELKASVLGERPIS